MRLKNAYFCVGVLLSGLVVSGCAVPHFDVPYNAVGQPTVKTIIKRIQCELRELVQDDVEGKPTPNNSHATLLLNWNMSVLIAMQIDVNESGGLTPMLAYINPTLNFTFGASGTLSEARQHTFTQNLQYSLRQIYIDWYAYNLAKNAGLDPGPLGLTAHECPPVADTNLAGTLGIADFVAMAAPSPGLDRETDPDKVFGGTIQFLVTKNVSAVGPTWNLVNFRGPGGLAGLSQVNTDKITLAFAPGEAGRMVLPTLAELKALAKSGRAFVPRTRAAPAVTGPAYLFLQQQLTGGIATQLNTLQNTIQSGVR